MQLPCKYDESKWSGSTNYAVQSQVVPEMHVPLSESFSIAEKAAIETGCSICTVDSSRTSSLGADDKVFPREITSDSSYSLQLLRILILLQRLHRQCHRATLRWEIIPVYGSRSALSVAS